MVAGKKAVFDYMQNNDTTYRKGAKELGISRSIIPHVNKT